MTFLRSNLVESGPARAPDPHILNRDIHIQPPPKVRCLRRFLLSRGMASPLSWRRRGGGGDRNHRGEMLSHRRTLEGSAAQDRRNEKGVGRGRISKVDQLISAPVIPSIKMLVYFHHCLNRPECLFCRFGKHCLCRNENGQLDDGKRDFQTAFSGSEREREEMVWDRGERGIGDARGDKPEVHFARSWREARRSTEPSSDLGRPPCEHARTRSQSTAEPRSVLPAACRPCFPWRG